MMRSYKRQLLSLSYILCVGVLLVSSCIDELHAKTKRILVYGDSLVAGYGLKLEQAFPMQLQKHLQQQGHDVYVKNAGVSGDTTKDGLERLEWTVGNENYDIVLLELGANDMLRLQDPQTTYDNLEKIIQFFKKRQIRILLCGMLAKRDYDQDYIKEFDGIYPRLATKHALDLYPFFLYQVANVPHLNLDDGIHPNKEGVQKIVKNILPFVHKMLVKMNSQSLR